MAQVRASAPSRRAPFGETAVHMGFVADADVRTALGEQEASRSHGAQPHAIGQLLQAKGRLSADQVMSVLRGMADGQVPLSRDGIRIAAQLRARHAAANSVIGIAGTTDDDAAATTAELAVTLSFMEQGRIVAIDTNLRDPQLHKLLDAPASPGLAEAIESGHERLNPIFTRFGSLAVLPAGHSAQEACTALMSPAAAQLVDVYRRQCRYVLLNLGDLLRRPEALVCASRCDSVVVVLRAYQTRKSQVAEIQRSLQGLNVAISGIVIAKAPRRKRVWSWFGGGR
jgi:Mrp family chromosome partitioning ATPase